MRRKQRFKVKSVTGEWSGVIGNHCKKERRKATEQFFFCVLLSCLSLSVTYYFALTGLYL